MDNKFIICDYNFLIGIFIIYKFLDKPLEELKPYIEHCKDLCFSFLRALYDGESNIYMDEKYHKRILNLYNLNIELLNYTKYLLK